MSFLPLKEKSGKETISTKLQGQYLAWDNPLLCLQRLLLIQKKTEAKDTYTNLRPLNQHMFEHQ